MKCCLVLLVVVATVASATTASAQRLDEMPIELRKKLREVERYQIKIAESYYAKKNWKVAMSEYEKYLTLYERSEGAAFSQLKWSICLVRQRKLNTAIRDGFQAVIDYWPDSQQAVAAAYYIGHTYKSMGEVRKAKKAYKNVLAKHPKHLVSVYAMNDLIDISRIEDDLDSRIGYWKKLTFDTVRTRESSRLCSDASQQLATHYFNQAAFNEAVAALATTYNEAQMPYYVLYFGRSPISNLIAKTESKVKGEKLADLGIAYIRSKLPNDVSTPEKKKIARDSWYYMADFLVAARRDAEVPKFYDKIMKEFSVEDETLGRLAGWFKSKNRYDEARVQYKRYDDKIEGQNQVAYTYRQQRKYDLAIVAYRQNMLNDPDNLVRWTAAIAQTYREAGKYKEAIATYEELLKLDIENSGSWRWQIATAHRDARQYKQAIAHFRQCTNFPTNNFEMAACHRRLKQYKEAILLYGQVVGGAPKSAASALIQIGYTQEEAGQKEQAILAFQQVCKRFPKASYASRAHAHLQNKYKISVTLGGAKDK